MLILLLSLRDDYLVPGYFTFGWIRSVDNTLRFVNILKKLNYDIIERIANIMCNKKPDTVIPAEDRNKEYDLMLDLLKFKYQ